MTVITPHRMHRCGHIYTVRSAQQCRLKSALFMAQLERYRDAIDIYQSIAREAVDSNLLKWSVKDYFLRAILCYLADNVC